MLKKKDINVECYSGYKADERPVSFIICDKKLKVTNILEQWRCPDSDHFKVTADDGKGYLLIHDIAKDVWILEKAFELQRK